MAGVIPLPVGRASSLLVQQRLIAQLQSDQQEIARLTSQLSTGRRVLSPSDDASAASRGVALQKVLEQKEQSQVNLNTSRSYLVASETSVARATDLLIEIRGAAVRAADTTTSDQERLAISAQIDAALGQLLNTGNQQFRDRYLFAGTTTTVQPYEVQNGAIVYRGNEGVLESYADVDHLFSASVAGSAVLGGLSAEVRGSAILTPAISENTKLADLHGGAGVELGSIVISDGVTSSTVDLTGAKTLGDVIRRIEAQPPQNRIVTVQLGPTGLNVSLDAVGGGALTVREAGGGRTAEQLGILAPGNGDLTVDGGPLEPRLRLTTPLDDVLGGGLDLDSGLHITIGGDTHTINFTGAETVEDLLNRLNGSPAPLHARINAAGTGIDIRSRVSGVDFRIGENGGATATQLGVRSYSRDTPLAELNYGRGVGTADGTDFTLRRSDGQELEIDLSSARTVGDVLDLINNHPDNLNPATAVTARLPSVGNGIELVDAGAVVTEPLTIIQATLSDAAFDLGFLAPGETEAIADAGTNTLIGRDVNSKEAAGAFNSFIRLSEAVLAGDVIAIGRAVELIDQDLERVTFARGELGSRQQSLDFLEHRLQDENVELRRTLSEEIEADLVETISNLTARQTSLEASLRQSAATLQTTLLDYL